MTFHTEVLHAINSIFEDLRAGPQLRHALRSIKKNWKIKQSTDLEISTFSPWTMNKQIFKNIISEGIRVLF